METRFFLRLAGQRQFKSYYVVWKHKYNADNTE